jgi:hypothetical protein
MDGRPRILARCHRWPVAERGSAGGRSIIKLKMSRQGVSGVGMAAHPPESTWLGCPLLVEGDGCGLSSIPAHGDID